MDRFAFYFLTHKYRLISKKGEGTFSEVIKAQSLKNSNYVAIKCMKNQFESIEQVNNLREIQALRRLSPHSNIVRLLEVLYDKPTGRLALCFELMDMNIYELIRHRKTYVQENRIKLIMFQVLKAVDHMHRNGIFHRDIKPENILMLDDKVKVADYGSCRGIYSKPPYTEYISTRWYRAPECLLTDGYYDYKMDLWGIGCVFFEVVALFPLFPGANELDQIEKIHAVTGTPSKELQMKFKRLSSHLKYNFPTREGTGIREMITHASPDCVDLIEKLIAYNPEERVTARQALRHPFFRDILEAEKRARAVESVDRGLSNTDELDTTVDDNDPSSGTISLPVHNNHPPQQAQQQQQQPEGHRLPVIKDMHKAVSKQNSIAQQSIESATRAHQIAQAQAQLKQQMQQQQQQLHQQQQQQQQQLPQIGLANSGLPPVGGAKKPQAVVQNKLPVLSQSGKVRAGASVAMLSSSGMVNHAPSQQKPMGAGAQPSTLKPQQYHYDDKSHAQAAVAKTKSLHHMPSVTIGNNDLSGGMSVHHLQPMQHHAAGAYHDNAAGGLYVSPYAHKHKGKE